VTWLAAHPIAVVSLAVVVLGLLLVVAHSAVDAWQRRRGHRPTSPMSDLDVLAESTRIIGRMPGVAARGRRVANDYPTTEGIR
jgi:hypothetical protein